MAWSVVSKNQDQAGLAKRFRTERPDFQRVSIVQAESLSVEEFQSNYVVCEIFIRFYVFLF